MRRPSSAGDHHDRLAAALGDLGKRGSGSAVQRPSAAVALAHVDDLHGREAGAVGPARQIQPLEPSGSKVKGKFAVAPLPHGAGGKSVATVGGWQLAVSRYSKNPDASIEFVRYMTSKPVNKFNTITNSNVPAIPSLANDPQVKKAAPYLNPATAGVPRATRPSAQLGARYNEGSKAIYQAVNRILNGASANSVLPGLEARLERLVR